MKTTQIKRIYDHLKTKDTITTKQAFNLYGICHLQAIIRDIKRDFGVEIFDWWQFGKNRFNGKCHWKVYSLHKQPEEGEAV